MGNLGGWVGDMCAAGTWWVATQSLYGRYLSNRRRERRWQDFSLRRKVTVTKYRRSLRRLLRRLSQSIFGRCGVLVMAFYSWAF